MAAEPCGFCPTGTSGPVARTPYGICEACSCSECRGFRRYDDRGFLYTGNWPTLFFADCKACDGEGTRSAEDDCITRLVPPETECMSAAESKESK